MKRFALVLTLIALFSVQSVAMAKGQWIYPYNHPTPSVQMDDGSHC